MIKRIVLNVRLFRGEWDRPRSQKSLLELMEAFSKHNQGHLEQMKYPPLYESGVRYRRETGEDWRDVPALLELGQGDCEDLACWRIAELRHAGRIAFPYMAYQRRPGGAFRYHALVQRFRGFDKRTGRFFGGSIDDPSRVLGMNGPEDQRAKVLPFAARHS